MRTPRPAAALSAVTLALAVQAQVTTEVAFTAQVDGTTQYYVQLVAPTFDTSKVHDVLIALHGAGFDRWQFATDQRDECRAARAAAASRGMIYISPDYRAPTSFMGIKADADVVQIIRDLRAKYHVGRVFICGASMGGGGCLTFTAVHPDLVSGVASMNGIVNYFEWPGGDWGPIVESFGGTMQQVPDEYRKRSAEFWPGRFTMPVGLAVSANDNVCPPAAVLRFAQALRDSGKSVLLLNDPSAGHATVFANAKAVLDFAIDSAKSVLVVPRQSVGRAGANGSAQHLSLRVPAAGMGAACGAPGMDLGGRLVAQLRRPSGGVLVVR